MCAYQVFVGLARGASRDFGQLIFDVIASTPLKAAMIAEEWANRRLHANEFAHAKSVDQIFPPPMGPTAVAA